MINSKEIIKTHVQAESKIGELKDLFESLEIMNMKLVESEKSKTRFLSLIRNEFDNPLVGMVSLMGQLHTTLKAKGGEEYELLHLAYMDALKLNYQLSNIVSAAAVETDVLEKNISLFNIASMMEDIDQGLTYILENKQNKVVKNITCSDAIYNDRDKIYTIIINLLANAYEYSLPDTEISIDIFEDDKKLFMSVRNVGSEIKDKKALFDAFYQQGQGFSRPHQGLGIGLSITKVFVEFLGGEIFITRDGNANVFIASLPLYENSDQISFGAELDGFMFD
ncbi:MAG: HAMP domain-containing sensor histidine kinase [Sulfurimonas sp.]|jgi:signal transduction histidine kinase